jgi:hypothetical protein
MRNYTQLEDVTNWPEHSPELTPAQLMGCYVVREGLILEGPEYALSEDGRWWIGKLGLKAQVVYEMAQGIDEWELGWTLDKLQETW